MKGPFYRSVGTLEPRFLEVFDSATAEVRALAHHLRGTGFAGVGDLPDAPPPFAAFNHLPRRTKETLYRWGRGLESIPARKLDRVRLDEADRWMEHSYPVRSYPAAFLGASNGALVHLAAAMDAPFLPQTFLIPVRHDGLDPDDPEGFLAWGREPGARLLAANPDLVLHHMHDPVQDRVMVDRMTYFRVKRQRLGSRLGAFLADRLVPGGDVVLVDQRVTWPTTTVDDRHVFQFGAGGGATRDEYHHGGPRVEDHLARHRSSRRRWHPPPPDGESPEAEWGFDAALTDDVVDTARRAGLRVHRLVVEETEDLSTWVADLHRWWYRRLRRPHRRLVVGSFVLQDPWWTLRTSSVPYWAMFNSTFARERLDAYLAESGDWEEVFVMLFSHGTESIGLASTSDWHATAWRHARVAGELLGVDEAAYPMDLTANVRYHRALKERVPDRYDLPTPLTLDEVRRFHEEEGARHKGVAWVWDEA